MAKVVAEDPLEKAIRRINSLLKSPEKKNKDFGLQLAKGLKLSTQYDDRNTKPAPPTVNQVGLASGLDYAVLDREGIILTLAEAAAWVERHPSTGARSVGTIRTWVSKKAKFNAIFGGREAFRRMATTNKKAVHKVYLTYAECLHLFEVADCKIIFNNYQLP